MRCAEDVQCEQDERLRREPRYPSVVAVDGLKGQLDELDREG